MNTTPLVQFNIDHLVIRPRVEISKEAWDAFVDISPQAWLNHTFDLQDAISTWPGKSDLSFALVDETRSGSIAAVLPLHRLERPFLKIFRNCWLDSNGAFAFHPDLSARQISRVADLMMEELCRLGKINSAEEIIFTIPPMTPDIRGQHCPRVNPLIAYGMENTLSQTYVIDLHHSKEEIWQKMERNCRTHIRKAEKSGITVRLADGDKDLETYYELHHQTYRRTGVSPHPYRYFEKIWHDFVSNGKAVVFFAELDGKVVAADNECAFKRAMSGWTAAGLAGSTAGANNLLHWTAIQWAIDHGFEYYESGEGFPGEQGGKRKGLNDFKKSFGGDLHPLYRGKIILRPLLRNLRNVRHPID